MSKDNSLLRNARNIVIISCLVFFILALCFYITGSLVLIGITGKWDVIKAYYKLPIQKQFTFLYQTMVTYWEFYLKNSAKLTKESYNYFAVKLWLTTLLPYSFLAALFWIFRAAGVM